MRSDGERTRCWAPRSRVVDVPTPDVVGGGGSCSRGWDGMSRHESRLHSQWRSMARIKIDKQTLTRAATRETLQRNGKRIGASVRGQSEMKASFRDPMTQLQTRTLSGASQH